MHIYTILISHAIFFSFLLAIPLNSMNNQQTLIELEQAEKYDNGHDQGLLKAKETLKQLGRPEDWRLKILPANNEIRDALFYGIWQQIAVRCHTNDPEFYCSFEEWAFKGPESKKK